jgi:hypothetical protein
MANDPLAITSISRVQRVHDALHNDDAEEEKRRRNAQRNFRANPTRPGPAAGSGTGSGTSETSQASRESAVAGNHGKLHVTA